MNTRVETIQFGEWLPDQADHENPGTLEAKNCIAEISGYRSFPNITAFSNALTGACLGTFWSRDNSGTTYNFAGDATKLYRLSGATWNDVSRTTPAYNADNWEFTKFGSRVIAANSGDQLQKFDMGTDSVFSNLTNAPTAKRIATIRDFVMVGNTAALGPNFIQWSGFNNSELWTPSIASQSDFQELRGKGGEIVKIVPGAFATIFSERALHVAQYAGPPTIFQIDEIDSESGTPAPNSVVKANGIIWFYGWDGFYAFDGRNKPVSISANKISKWFKSNAAQEVLSSMRGAVDRVNNLIVWAFKSSVSSTYNDRLIMYNWIAKRWSYAELSTQVISEYITEGYTLDQLDTLLTNGIDTDSILVDTNQYQGGALNLLAFTTTNTAATFGGAGISATIETREISSPEHDTLYLNSVRPLIECSATPSIGVAVGHRKTLRENVLYTSSKQVNNVIGGEANIRKTARYMRFRVTVAGCFNHAKGVKASLLRTGSHR